MKILILENSNRRYRKMLKYIGHLDVTRVISARAAIEVLAHNRFDIVMLDHDLNAGDGTGMQVVDWMCSAKPKIKGAVVHSINGHFAPIMVKKLREHYETISAVKFWRSRKRSFWHKIWLLNRGSWE